MELGVQLYGCMPELRADPEQFCARLSAAGYTHLESCISLNMTEEQLKSRGLSPVWLPEEVDGFVAIMKKHGLRLQVCHVFADVEADADKIVALAEKYSLKQIVVGCRTYKTVEECKGYADMCLALAEKLAAVGTALWMHNGWPEVRAKIGDKTVLEITLELCEGKVKAQLDTGWALYGGKEPCAYIKKLYPYMGCVHYKDILEGFADMDMAKIHIALGKGAVDWAPIHAFAVEKGLPEIIDQDLSPEDFVRDLEETAALLKNA